jgi:hypothetical protein
VVVETKGGVVFERMPRFVVLGLVVAGLVVPTAAADKPSKEPFPSSDLTGRFCEDFDVRFHVTDDRGTLHVFSSGVALVTGTLKIEVTNLASDRTLALNISGPGKFSPDGSSLTGTGRWLLFGEAGELPGPDPGMLLTTGRMTLGLSPTGIESIETQGTVTDVCALLAAD